MDEKILQNELKFKAIPSGGPGGQHANKVSSKIILTFNLLESKAFTEDEIALLTKNLEHRLSKENILTLSCDESRSQHQNKAIITKRFNKLIEQKLKVLKERKATKPSKNSVIKRLDSKQMQSSKKVLRRKPKIE